MKRGSHEAWFTRSVVHTKSDDVEVGVTLRASREPSNGEFGTLLYNPVACTDSHIHEHVLEDTVHQLWNRTARSATL